MEVGYALGLDLTGGMPRFACNGERCALIRSGVELGMGDFMDHSFQGLGLAHTGPDYDPPLLTAEIAVSFLGKILKYDGDGGQLFQCPGDVLVLLHIASQHRSNLRQLLPLGLGHIEHSNIPACFMASQRWKPSTS